MTLRYDFGRLILAETRGDGFTGEDITLNAKMIQNVPLCIAEMDPIEIRGEVYMDSKDFDLANERQEKKGAKLFANARNCAAGSLRQLNANITKERNLKFFAFNIQSAPEAYMISQVEGKRKLDTWGFSPVRGSLCNNYAEICETINAIGLMRNSLAYGIDGAVIKVNQKALQNEFPVGTGLKYSAGMIAFKYPSEEKEAIITDIELTVGRTGRVNPTAIFEDENGKTNLALADVDGELLLVSQFTLYANCKKGNRPSFINAGAPDMANEMYEYIIEKCREMVKVVETGEFGADMKVKLENDGPFTIVLDSEQL